jgi:hypothetical protein
MKTEFIVEDFGQFDSENCLTTSGDACDIANKLLPVIKAAWLAELLTSEIGEAAKKELLKDAPTVYALKDSYSWHIAVPRNLQGDSLATHTGKLVDIKRIEK